MFEPKIVRNNSPDDHLQALHHILKDAKQVSTAVAFLKRKGLSKIVSVLTARLAAGTRVEMFIGSDFCLSEPDALKDLLNLSRQHPFLEVFLAKPDASSTFHPKLYLGSDGKVARLLLGSANLTGGALSANDEISLAFSLGMADALLEDVRKVFSDYRLSARFEELDEIVLERYRSKYKIAEDARRRVDREIASSEAATFDIATLISLYDEFSQDRDEMASLAKRRRDRKHALAIQRRIAKLNALGILSRRDRTNFETFFRNLVTSGDGHSHLWHSGDIHRRGQAALRQPRKTIALFAEAQEAARLPPTEGYANVRRSAREIAGVGINMVSEILCTFAPKRYAVFNGNTAAALRALGADPPKSVTLFSPEAYARVCGVVEAVRRRIGGEDLSDTDAFLNWIYQTKVKAAAG